MTKATKQEILKKLKGHAFIIKHFGHPNVYHCLCSGEYVAKKLKLSIPNANILFTYTSAGLAAEFIEALPTYTNIDNLYTKLIRYYLLELKKHSLPSVQKDVNKFLRQLTKFENTKKPPKTNASILNDSMIYYAHRCLKNPAFLDYFLNGMHNISSNYNYKNQISVIESFYKK